MTLPIRFPSDAIEAMEDAALAEFDHYEAEQAELRRVRVYPGGFDIAPASGPTRAYDFNKGDRRFCDQARAIEHANSTALETGVRQVVRVTSPALDRGAPLYLVQAVGS